MSDTSLPDTFYAAGFGVRHARGRHDEIETQRVARDTTHAGQRIFFRRRDFSDAIEDFKRAALRQAQARTTGNGVNVAVYVGNPWAIQCYNSFMSSKLSVVNPYLRDPVVRELTVRRSVASSSAIEGIRAPFQRTATGKSASTARVKPAGKTRLTSA